jgi:hypothetical protein
MRVKLKESTKVSSLSLPRRGFLASMASLLAAPAVVRAEVLMSVKVWRPTPQYIWRPNFGRTRAFGQDYYVCKVEKLIGCEDWALVELPRLARRPLPGTKPNGRGINGYYLIGFDCGASARRACYFRGQEIRHDVDPSSAIRAAAGAALRLPEGGGPPLKG